MLLLAVCTAVSVTAAREEAVTREELAGMEARRREREAERLQREPGGDEQRGVRQRVAERGCTDKGEAGQGQLNQLHQTDSHRQQQEGRGQQEQGLQQEHQQRRRNHRVTVDPTGRISTRSVTGDLVLPAPSISHGRGRGHSCDSAARWRLQQHEIAVAVVPAGNDGQWGETGRRNGGTGTGAGSARDRRESRDENEEEGQEGEGEEEEEEEHGVLPFLGQLLEGARNLPRGVKMLLLVTALTWLAWFPFLLFDTDWMGREVFRGMPGTQVVTKPGPQAVTTPGSVAAVLTGRQRAETERQHIPPPMAAAEIVLPVGRTAHGMDSADTAVRLPAGKGGSPGQLYAEGVRAGALGLFLCSVVQVSGLLKCAHSWKATCERTYGLVF